MRSLLSIAIVSLAAFTLSSTALADQHSEDDKVLKKLAGVWEVEEGVNQGKRLSEDELEGTVMKIEKNIIVTYDKDKKEKYRSSFTIDTSTDPISIDMTPKMKGVPPTKAFGIIKFEEDDEFLICYALPGSERPKKFESPAGSKIMLFECEKDE